LKVSIVIPSFNNADFISETLESVLAQTYLDYECIVVDDGSKDETLLLVSNFSELNTNFKLFKRPADLPKGANSCRNFGASQATGNLLLFLDADDLLTKDCLESRLSNYRGQDLFVGSTGCFSNKI
jgi:glycosyltransferase involved in cell wall biosynthesis